MTDLSNSGTSTKWRQLKERLRRTTCLPAYQACSRIYTVPYRYSATYANLIEIKALEFRNPGNPMKDRRAFLRFRSSTQPPYTMDSIDQEKQKLAADAEREFTRLWRSWRTIHEMCQDRVRLTPLACISREGSLLTNPPRATS